MIDQEIIQIWNTIVDYHKKFLTDKHVKLPTLKDANGYTKNALVLIRLAKGYPNTDIVSKEELTDFIKQFYPKTNDVQQARHLSMQSGWNILSGTRGDNKEKIPSGSYKLVDLENSYSAFAQERRVGFDSDDFDAIKKKYAYKCASCGSKEGEEHFFRKGVRVKLQKGHMNPSKPLIAGNIIPQCQICNRGDRNRWIYDKTGRVIEIADTADGFRVVARFIKNTSNAIRSKLLKLLNG